MQGYSYTTSDFDQALKGIRPYADLSWFAIDPTGHLGVFLSAGFGAIPISVLKYPDLHKAVYERIFGYSDTESRDIVDIASAIGCYIYDWDGPIWLDEMIPYTRIHFPDCPHTVDFDAFDWGKVALPFYADFSTVSLVKIPDLDVPLNC